MVQGLRLVRLLSTRMSSYSRTSQHPANNLWSSDVGEKGQTGHDNVRVCATGIHVNPPSNKLVLAGDIDTVSIPRVPLADERYPATGDPGHSADGVPVLVTVMLVFGDLYSPVGSQLTARWNIVHANIKAIFLQNYS